MPEWSNLVGKTAKEAEKIIIHDMPNANVQILPEGSLVTEDYRSNRVRVFVDAQNKVTSEPHVG